MLNVYEADATAAAPLAPSTTPGNPTDGGLGQPTTIPGAYWFYQVTTEILNAITAGGLTPSKTTLNQLSTAIGNRISSAGYNWAANSNQGQNGYRKFPDGSADQWGQIAVTPAGANPCTFTVTYPIPFTATGCPLVTMWDSSTPGPGDGLILWVETPTLSGFTGQYAPNGATTRNATVRWQNRGTV